jgi:divalent metal cation (Fe/Co/Zn/Cd) transporter
MLTAAAYVLARAAWSLITQAHPAPSVTGLVLLAGSLVVLPVLGYVKLRLAGQLRSRALRRGRCSQLGWGCPGCGGAR